MFLHKFPTNNKVLVKSQRIFFFRRFVMLLLASLIFKHVTNIPINSSKFKEIFPAPAPNPNMVFSKIEILPNQ